MSLEVTKQELLKQAIYLKKLYETTRNQEYKDQETRLRRIVVELDALTIGTSNVTDLDSLTDVTISAPANAQVLTYNSTTSQWENQTPAAGGGGDMLKSTYDVDNDGVVDSAETTQIIVRNSTGSTLTKGQVVYLSGATGNRPNAVLSKADTEATSSKTIGIVVANITNNSDGYVAVSGTLHNLDTSAFADGDAVWLSATTAGAYTSTIPSEPNHTVFIGYVARSHPTQGRLVILIQNGYELNELHGVLISSEANNDLLTYESSTGLWKNKTVSTIFGGTPLVSVPTLDQVTSAGNTTTNAITTGLFTAIVTSATNSSIETSIISQISRPAVANGAVNRLLFKDYVRTTGSASVLGSVGSLDFYRTVSATQTLGRFDLNIKDVNPGDAQIRVFSVDYNGTTYLNVNGGNTLIGTTTDAGYKLDVNGTARFVAQTYYGTFSESATIYSSDTFAAYSSSAASLAFYLRNGFGGSGRFIFSSAGKSGTTTQTQYLTQFTATYNPTSGTGLYTMLELTPTINQTGGANGITRGIHVNPTLTAAADFRAIEATGRIFSVYNAPFDATASNANFVLQHSNGSQAGIGITSDGAMRVKAPGSSPFVIISGSVQTWFNRYSHSSIQAFNTDFGIYGGSDVQKFRIFNSTGNVLIQNGGTFTDAGFKLDVNGSTRVQLSGTNYFTIDTTNGYVTTFNPVGDNYYRLGPSSSASAIWFHADRLRIGTGTSSTSYKPIIAAAASVFGNIDLGGGSNSLGLNYGEKLNFSDRIQMGMIGTQYFRIGYVNGDLGAKTIMTIYGGGNVGIGTTTPTAPLHVATSITASTSLAQGVYFNNTLVAAANNDVLVGLDINPTFTNGAFTGVSNYGMRINGASATLNINSATGTVARLTTSVNYLIGPDSEIATLNGVTGNQFGIFRGGTVFGVSGYYGIQYFTSGTERMRLFQNGNFAIGTTTDAGYKLDVNGQVRIVGNLLLGLTSGSGNLSAGRIYSKVFREPDGDSTYLLFNWSGYTNNQISFGTPQTTALTLQAKSTGYVTIPNGNVLIGTTTDAGQKLQISGSIFIKGTTSLTATKIFEVQNGSGTSIMDFRDNQYAFFGCGQGGGSASGFIFNYSNTSYTQFSGYNYGAGSGSYKPILMDTDGGGRNQGIFVNFGVTTNTPPNSDTEFAVRGRTSDSSTYISKFVDSSNVERFSIRADGALFTDGNIGYTGTVNFPTNPPGQQNIDIVNGIIVNVF